MRKKSASKARARAGLVKMLRHLNDEIPEVQPAPVPEVKQTYKFKPKSEVQCRRCGGRATLAYATVGPVQYRECQAPVCRERFTVTGEAV